MNNPFLVNNALQYEASINRTVLLDIDWLTQDATIVGKTAAQVFSIDAIIDEIKRRSNELKIDVASLPEKELPIHLNDCLESRDKKVRQAAEQIARKFGERLGIILYRLKHGKSESEKERKDWRDEGWALWQQIENVILSGGLASQRLGSIFKEHIYQIFYKAGIEPYQVFLTKDSSLAGLTGAAVFIKEAANANLVFDFGQSFLKRGIAFFQGNVLTDLEPQPKIPSKFMEWSTDETVDLTPGALQLDRHLQQTIESTIQEVSRRGIAVGEEIAISLANYISSGKIQYRGGYGKLRFISPDYEQHLSGAISELAGRIFKVKIIHDGTAIAANFMDIPNAASIAIGTSFGIGFPVPEAYHKTIGEGLNIFQV